MAKRKRVVDEPVPDADIHTRIRNAHNQESKIASPLTTEHLRMLNECLTECAITANMCEQCQNAGMDISPEMQANKEQMEMAKKLKAAFFPGSI